MKKVTITAIMLVLAMFMLTTNVQAYSMSFSGTKTTVESGETFNVTVSVDEATTRANGHIKYDSSLFTFVSSTGSNMTANATSGTVQWLYSEPVGQETGTKSFTFTFKAADVTETKKGTFTMEDFIAITKDNEEGYGQDKNTIGGTSSVEVTINKKSTEPTWKIDPSEDFTLEKGESKQLTADEDVTWSTSDSSVATVDKNGKVTGVGEGSATITATDKDGNKQTVTVTVTDNSQTSGDDDKHDNWSIEPSEDFSLKVGDKKKLTADGEGITWKSSNEKVAKVDQNGNVTAVGAGTATITATDKYGNTKTIKVTVTKKTTTAGKKDNTQTPNKKLPQTGENAGKFAVLGIAGIVLAAGLVFKKKAKELDKLFVLLPIVAVLSLSGSVHAVKLTESSKYKTGIFYKLVEGKNVLAISPNKEFETKDQVTVKDVKNLLSSVDVKKATNTDKKELKESDKVATGTVVTVGLKKEDSEKLNTEEKEEKKTDFTQITWDYTVLLYGDANGDGKICDALDVDVIRQDYVFNKKAEGEYKVAADLAADGKLNVRDIQRMINKYLGKLNDTVVNPFPEEETADKGETDNVSEAVAMSKDTGKMYKTVQDAANAVSRENETIILLKDTKESFEVPEDKTMILDLYGNKITGTNVEYTILSNGNLTVMSSVAVANGKHYGQVNAADNGLTAITTKGNLTITTNDDKTGSTQIMLTAKKDEKDKAANIKNIGENNTILIKGGASLSGGINGHEFSFGILDEGTETTINVEEGIVSGSAGAIKKTGTGTINIGRNDQEMDDLFGQNKKATAAVGARDAGLIVDKNVKVNFYNGRLGCTNGDMTCENTDGSVHRIDGHRDGYGKTIGLHGGEYGQYAYYMEKDRLVAEVKSTEQQYASLGTAFGALTVTSKDKKDEVVTLLKDITESSTFPEDVTATLDLQKHTITGRENGGVTLYVEGDLTIKNGTVQTNSEYQNEVNNILMKKKGTLTLENDVTLILNSAKGSNIRNEGTGDITINNSNLLNPANFESENHTWKESEENKEEQTTETTEKSYESYGINDIGVDTSKSDVEESYSDITITSGCIEGDCAIYKKDEGIITVGKEDSNINMEDPQIVGYESGIDGEAGSGLEVHFYDGIIEAIKEGGEACNKDIEEFENEIAVKEDDYESDEEENNDNKYVIVGGSDGEESEIYYEKVEDYEKELEETEKKATESNGSTKEEAEDENGNGATTPTAQAANSAAAMALKMVSNL